VWLRKKKGGKKSYLLEEDKLVEVEALWRAGKNEVTIDSETVRKMLK